MMVMEMMMISMIRINAIYSLLLCIKVLYIYICKVGNIADSKEVLVIVVLEVVVVVVAVIAVVVVLSSRY